MRQLMMALMAVAMIGLLVGTGAMILEDTERKNVMRQLQIETDLAQARADEAAAEADRLQAQADLERAQGEAYMKAAEGDAIKAPALAAARAVDQNTDIVGAMGKTNTFYDRILPLGGVLVMVVLVFFGVAMGLIVAFAFVWYREQKKNQGLKLEVPVADAALDIK